MIDMSILTRGAVDLYALFEWGLTVEVHLSNYCVELRL
ncbi:hypothetical protein B4064_3431 [Caldibacillus thermoamylovorans]|nr:hypothetical protein B4064_3431 [Caldibacillus thermoamylovorans]